MGSENGTRGLVALADGCTQPWLGWRRGQLLHAGFGEALAGQLAADHDVDLHELLGLVARGCPPELAARILAPAAETGPGAIS